jgi:hypothetical protein
MKAVLLSSLDLKRICDGEKKYVLKKKCVNTRLALLCKTPFSAVGIAKICVHSGRPKKVFDSVAERLGIDKNEFFTYFDTRLTASVIEIKESFFMEDPIEKKDLIEILEGMGVVKTLNATIPENAIKTIIKNYFINKNIPIGKDFEECLEKENLYPECEKIIYI